MGPRLHAQQLTLTFILLLLAGEEDRMVCAPNLYTNVVPIPFNLKVNIDSGWKRDGIRSLGTGSE